MTYHFLVGVFAGTGKEDVVTHGAIESVHTLVVCLRLANLNLSYIFFKNALSLTKSQTLHFTFLTTNDPVGYVLYKRMLCDLFPQIYQCGESL